MTILQKEVEIMLNGKNTAYYENQGYIIPRYKHKSKKMFVRKGTKLNVKIEDLQRQSNVRILASCRVCGKPRTLKYQDYVNRKGYCPKCANQLEEKRSIISVAHKGKSLSKEHKLRISESQRGKVLSNEHKQRLSKANRGKVFTAEHRCKLSESHKGERNPFYGRHHTKETIQRMSGENNVNWKGGITSEYVKIRESHKNRIWRRDVFERDMYTCQKCGDTQGGNLNAHHIINFADIYDTNELAYDTTNGITFCDVCHRRFHRIYGKMANNYQQVDEFLTLSVEGIKNGN